MASMAQQTNSMNQELKDELETLQSVYSDEELSVNNQATVGLLRVRYIAKLNVSTACAINVEFRLEYSQSPQTKCTITVSNAHSAKQSSSLSSEHLQQIEKLLTQKYRECEGAMPLFQCISYCNEELIHEESLNLSQILKSTQVINDVVDEGEDEHSLSRSQVLIPSNTNKNKHKKKNHAGTQNAHRLSMTEISEIFDRAIKYYPPSGSPPHGKLRHLQKMVPSKPQTRQTVANRINHALPQKRTLHIEYQLTPTALHSFIEYGCRGDVYDKVKLMYTVHELRTYNIYTSPTVIRWSTGPSISNKDLLLYGFTRIMYPRLLFVPDEIIALISHFVGTQRNDQTKWNARNAPSDEFAFVADAELINYSKLEEENTRRLWVCLVKGVQSEQNRITVRRQTKILPLYFVSWSEKQSVSKGKRNSYASRKRRAGKQAKVKNAKNSKKSGKRNLLSLQYCS